MELAIVHEMIADDSRAASHAEAALRIEPDLAPAHAMLRRRKHGGANIREMLVHLEAELAGTSSEASGVELIAERARLLDASGEMEQLRVAWDQALMRSPHHAAALKGLEGELVAKANLEVPDANDALANHLARMADAYASEPRLAAWLHVERAQILERKLGRVDAARGALERAVRLDPSVGPVRDAFVRHVAAHNDMATLVQLLEEEAQIEKNAARSARLELDAAIVCQLRLRDSVLATTLLERAAARIPTVPAVDRRVLDELISIYEEHAQWADAARARRARLRFVTDPAPLAYELRTLASLCEKRGDFDVATADVERALTLDSNDTSLVEMLDRLLAAANKDEQRITLWLDEAARIEDGTKKGRALAKAATICEGMTRVDDAVRHMRAAWMAAPGDSEVLDGLARLLTPHPTEETDGQARQLIELYVHAVTTASDPARKIAYLEKIALLWEDFIGDSRRAARAYEDVLAIEPGRRGAVLGLARTAARLGDDRALARALLDEARRAEDGVDGLALRVRAAQALARVDPARATSIVAEVLQREPAHGQARTLETRLHEDAGRWESACTSIRARIDLAKTNQERLSLWLALAQIQDTRLRSANEALKSLKAAAAIDPKHPVPPAEIARVLAAIGDDHALRAALVDLAADSLTSEDRARNLVKAAEIDELRLGDDASAVLLYTRALAETPDDELAHDRLARVLVRRSIAGRGATSASSVGTTKVTPAGMGERAAMLAKRLERATTARGGIPPAPPGAPSHALSFELALVLVELGQDLAHASGLLETLLVDQPDYIPALRTLEQIARKTNAWASLARVLSQEGTHFVDVRARSGALWNLAALEEWRLPSADPGPTYARILELDPTDPAALDATMRRDLAAARRGDVKARRGVIGALRALCALATDGATALAIQLRLALLLETAAAEGESGGAREALERYRAALIIDPLSVTAATSLARLSNRLSDTHGAALAAMSLAELATTPRTRARYLFDAAELLLGPADDERLGTPHERHTRAAAFLEKALDADPDSIPAAGRLATIRLEMGQPQKLVETFRACIHLAKSPDSIVMLGSEIARVARDELGDLQAAIDSMRKVRSVAPQHVPSLLTLAELCIAQRAWDDAVEALEAVVATAREPAPRMTALFALASVYEKVLGKRAEAERAIRSAISTEPRNPRAIRALIHHLAQQAREGKAGARVEIAELLGRLADVEREVIPKSTILLELAELRLELGDHGDAERALIEAVAVAPNNKKAFARLAAFFQTPKGRDSVSYARALHALIGTGQKHGAVDPRWLATLGQIEVGALGRLRDGVVHLQRAVQMDAALFETRFELAQAFERMNAHEEATRTVLQMIVPTPRPLLSIGDPGAALELLERSLGGERRAEEALVISELRAIAGDLDEGRHSWLRSRRLPPFESHHSPLDRLTLVSHLIPPEGRHVMLDIAAAIAGIESRILRADLTELGISARDRIGPRSGNATRALLDRMARSLGLSEIDLIITPSVSRTRVLAQDTLWVVVPRSLVELPEPTQLASLGRALARIALGVPWLEELPPPHIEALLIAAARQVIPNYGADEVDVLSSKLVAQYEPTVAKGIVRKNKKFLEELAPHLVSPQGRPVPVDSFIGALARAELRAAYVLTGDLLATIDELRGLDASFLHATESPGRAALAAVLDHPFAGDVTRFALTTEATALRRRVGATWTG
jgi:tetratricopeptide (TPR) repeat protein